MLSISMLRALTRRHFPAIAAVLLVPGILAGVALAAQDRSALQVPNGLAFSEFKGYEDWQPVAVSQTETLIKVIVANPIMMEAFKSGLPSDGKLFPDGSKVAKIEWTFKKNALSPYSVDVPDTLKALAFIEKDTKRFPNTHGWAYAEFDYDTATDTLKPLGEGAECGFACHTRVAGQDYTFTAYPKR